MELNPYINFNGQCEAAFKFYEKCTGAKITSMMTFGQSPMAGDVPPEMQKQILHATLNLGGRSLMGCDAPPNRFEAAKGTHLSLSFTDVSEAERVYKALSEKGTVTMPLQKTFWASRFGMFVDQFGIPWMINCN